MESGWSMEEFDSPGESLRAYHFPSTLARIGLHERVELRIGWDGGQWQRLDLEGEEVGSSSFSCIFLVSGYNGDNQANIEVILRPSFIHPVPLENQLLFERVEE